MARKEKAPPPNRTLEEPYKVALHRVLEYLLDNEPLWHGERLDFEEGDAATQAEHIFSAFQAMHAWLTRGVLEVELGCVVTTPGALEALDELDMVRALRRHRAGDWGDLHREDWQQNDAAVEEGRKLLSRYHSPDGGRTFWIITEADRSVTTVLLPEEY